MAEQEWNPFGDINVDDIPMQILDKWKEEDDKINEGINESCPNGPAPQFNDITYQQVNVDLLISEPEPPPPLEFWPLNYQQRKTITTRIFHLMWDKNYIASPFDGVGEHLHRPLMVLGNTC